MIKILPITKKITQTNYGSRNGNSIKYIVCHYTGNATDTAAANANYFYTDYRGASAHYFVDDNSIYQVVEDNNASWAVGDGKGAYGITNQNSISIEMCCKNTVITETTENNAIELVKYLMNKFSYLQISESAIRITTVFPAGPALCGAAERPFSWLLRIRCSLLLLRCLLRRAFYLLH